MLLLAACADAPQPAEPSTGSRSDLFLPSFNGNLGDPLPGLTDSERLAFARGKAVFQRQFVQGDGLGPIFNASSCSECHGENGEDGGVIGGTGDDLERHFTRLSQDGSCSKLASRGGFVHQDSATFRLTNLTGITTEPFPTVAHDTGTRSTPDLFGFGLVAGIPDAAILALADPNDANNDGISGRVSWVGTAVGRFGRKANDNDLDHFNAGAMLNEIGVTNPQFLAENRIGSDTIGSDSIPANVDPAPEPELGSADLGDLNAFVRFLAPPPTTAVLSEEQLQGKLLFNSMGCTRCHTPEFTTGPSSSAALSYQTVRPFSDFLLHDMGFNLGDICLGNTTNTEFRTEPLMGARFMEVFLHDGRAPNIGHAILQHGGEAQTSRDAFAGLNTAQRSAVVAYIKTL
ncbi:MAG TPA: di-heme oxidoredictase family protein [Longimicrobium sp.]|nr:di-heme oxidoredictase family protein [Longimicrobium sp.]